MSLPVPAGYRRTAFGLVQVPERVGVAWQLEDDVGNVRDVTVSGEATSYSGRIEIDAFACIDDATGDEIEMCADDRERAEDDLRYAAAQLWRSR